MLKNVREKGIELDGLNKRMQLTRDVVKNTIREKTNMFFELQTMMMPHR